MKQLSDHIVELAKLGTFGCTSHRIGTSKDNRVLENVPELKKTHISRNKSSNEGSMQRF